MTPGRALTVAAVLAALWPASGRTQDPSVTRQIRQNQSRLDSIRDERQQLEGQLDRLRGEAHTLTSELQNIERQKLVTTRLVNELDRQLGFLNAQLDTVTMELILAEDAHTEKRAVLERRLVDIYKRGPLWMFEVLLAAESFGDLLSRYKYLYLVSRQDRALVGEVEELRGRVARQRTQLVTLQRESQGRRDDRGRELGRYTSLELQRQRTLRQTQTSQRVTSTRLDSLARAEEQLSALIASLEEARRRAVAAGAPDEATITAARFGQLPWPVEGAIAYRYGRYAGPDQTTLFRQGIGIRAAVGTPVRAVAGGTVAHVGPLGTWGQTVILQHGGGFMTLYLYLSEPRAAVGTYVREGTVIGLSGGANTDVGPHVEFQIREGTGESIALDPMGWLRRR